MKITKMNRYTHQMYMHKWLLSLFENGEVEVSGWRKGRVVLLCLVEKENGSIYTDLSRMLWEADPYK